MDVVDQSRTKFIFRIQQPLFPCLAWLCSIHGALCCPLISSVISMVCASISVYYWSTMSAFILMLWLSCHRSHMHKLSSRRGSGVRISKYSKLCMVVQVWLIAALPGAHHLIQMILAQHAVRIPLLSWIFQSLAWLAGHWSIPKILIFTITVWLHFMRGGWSGNANMHLNKALYKFQVLISRGHLAYARGICCLRENLLINLCKLQGK